MAMPFMQRCVDRIASRHSGTRPCASRRWAERITSRPPDLVIGSEDSPYLLRWHLLQTRWMSLYLHRIMRSDDDRALHDHPAWNLSLLLSGSYTEVMPRQQRQHQSHDFACTGIRRVLRHRGSLILRPPRHRHRLEVTPNQPCTTLWLRGPKVHGWGFYCRQGFVPWQRFVDPERKGQISTGCGT